MLHLLSELFLPTTKRTDSRDVPQRQSAVSWRRVLRWLESWSHLHRVLCPRRGRLVGTVLQSSRKSGGRHRCHSGGEYGPSSNDLVRAPPNPTPDTKRPSS